MTNQFIQPKETIFQNKIFMKLFASYSISMLGHWFDMVAVIILFSYIWQASPMVIAFIPVAYALPQVILGQFVGVLTDKHNKVKIMMISDFTTAALTLGLLFTNSPWPALVVIALRSAVNVVHAPAQQGMIKLVVKEALIMKAVTLNGTVNQLSKIIGPFIGATLIGVFSPKICILINAIAFTISALILCFVLLREKIDIKVTAVAGDNQKHQSFFSLWREGWVIVFSNKILLSTLLTSFIGLTAIQMVDIQFPVLFREIAPNNPEISGWLMGASGLGAVLMILYLNRLETLKNYGWLFGLSVILIGVGFGAVALLKEGFLLMLPILYGIVVGVGVGLLTITTQYVIQKETSTGEIGRISGIMSTTMYLTVLVSPLLGGFLVEIYGVVPIYLASSIALSLLGISLIAGNSFFFSKTRGEVKRYSA